MSDPLLDSILQQGAVPAHVAIIMDGNGRWAQARALPRPAGHQAGMQAVREAVEGARSAGVKVLTLFAFSQENWQRPEEIDALMALLEEYIAREQEELIARGVSVRFLGDLDRLVPSARAAVDDTIRATAGGTELALNICISYGSRAELTRAARLIAEDVAAGRLVPAEVDEAALARRLYTAAWPDPDLLIRTSGELRLSNFLLWQLAYAELFVTPVLWPDFTRHDFFEAVVEFQRRDRRFRTRRDLMDRNMQTRIAFAVVAIPLALGIVWFGGWALVALLAAAGVLGTRELFNFAAQRGIRPSPVLGLGAAVLAAPITWLSLSRPDVARCIAEWWPYAGAMWVLAVLTWATARRAPEAHPLGAVTVTLVGPLYAAALPAFLLVLRHSSYGLMSWAGTALVFFPLVVTWVGDSAAMSGGRAFGGPKMAPTISPGKTRSGGIAGLVGATLAGALLVPLALRPAGIDLGVGAAAGMGLLLGMVGQVGDLAESLLKREAGVKDSSHLIPGHGGVLDRFDSLIFVLPVAALLFRLLGVI